MKTARAAAVLTWIYAAAFGLPAIPISAYLVAQGHLPTFMGLFETYGNPWSARVQPRSFNALLAGFFDKAYPVTETYPVTSNPGLIWHESPR